MLFKFIKSFFVVCFLLIPIPFVQSCLIASIVQSSFTTMEFHMNQSIYNCAFFDLQWTHKTLNSLIVMPPLNVSSTVCFIPHHSQTMKCFYNHTNTIVYNNSSSITHLFVNQTLIGTESDNALWIIMMSQPQSFLKKPRLDSFTSLYIGLFLMMIVFTFCFMFHFIKHRLLISNV